MANPVDLASTAPWVSVRLYPPAMGRLLEVGWYDARGEWCRHFARLMRDGHFHTETGARIADPDWWKEPTPPPSKNVG